MLKQALVLITPKAVCCYVFLVFHLHVVIVADDPATARDTFIILR